MPAIRLTRTHRILIGVVVAGALLIAATGFVGSYTAVRDLAQRQGFGWFSGIFPLGIDVGIVVLLSLDLQLTFLRIPFPLLRHSAWVLTAATIAFNGAAAWPDPLGVGMHAIIPLLFIITVEAARHSVGRIAAITADRHIEPVRLTRWLLAPAPTFRLWRRMKLWELRSYDHALDLERDRLVYQARLRAHYGRAWRRVAPTDALLPLRLTKYGIPLPPANVSGASLLDEDEDQPVDHLMFHTPHQEPATVPVGPGRRRALSNGHAAVSATRVLWPDREQPPTPTEDGARSAGPEAVSLPPMATTDREPVEARRPVPGASPADPATHHTAVSPPHPQSPPEHAGYAPSAAEPATVSGDTGSQPSWRRPSEGQPVPAGPPNGPGAGGRTGDEPAEAAAASPGQPQGEPAWPDQASPQAPANGRAAGQQGTARHGRDTGRSATNASGSPADQPHPDHSSAQDLPGQRSAGRAGSVVDTYFAAFCDFSDRHQKFPSAAQLAQHLLERYGVTGRGDGPLSPVTLRRHMPNFSRRYQEIVDARNATQHESVTTGA